MFSIITPLDPNRLKQFRVTKELYDNFSQPKEFIIPTRHPARVRNYLYNHRLAKDVVLVPYSLDKGFNQSKALNLGVERAKYPSIIITNPEVMPMTPVLDQLEPLIGQNVICKVVDEDETGNVSMTLVDSNFRSSTPAMYFLAMLNKADIEAINGWDEEFTKGYAYEDNDFGDRWVRAGLPFIVRDDILGRHQYHPRSETIPGGLAINYHRWQYNNGQALIRPLNGLIKL